MTRRQAYFIKQKLIGVGVLLLTAFIVFILKEATIAFLTAPIGLVLIFSRKMIWKDNYYYEVKRKEKG